MEVTAQELAILDQVLKAAKLSKWVDEQSTDGFPSFRQKNLLLFARVAFRAGFRVLKDLAGETGRPADGKALPLFPEHGDDRLVGLPDLEGFVEGLKREVRSEWEMDDTGKGPAGSEPTNGSVTAFRTSPAALRSRLTGLDQEGTWPSVEDIRSWPKDSQAAVADWVEGVDVETWSQGMIPAPLRLPSNFGACHHGVRSRRDPHR